MNLSRWTLAWLAITSSSFPLMASYAANSPEKNIPALLQFAQKYQDTNNANESKKSTTLKSKPTGSLAYNSGNVAEASKQTTKLRPGNWRIKDTELIKQQRIIEGLDKELSALRLKLEQMEVSKPVVTDMKELSLFSARVRRALSMTPEEKTVQEKIMQANLHVAELTKSQQALRTQLDKMTLQKDALDKMLITTKLQLEEQLKTNTTSLKDQQDVHNKALTKLQQELAAAKANQPVVLTQASLNSAGARQNYAAGVSLGEEIMQMQAERNRWGVKTDKDLILAGIIDTFSDRRRLADDILNRALTDAENEVTRAREKTVSAQVNQGNSYIEKFKHQKGVREGTGGVFYKIDYVGDIPITKEAIVDLIVKEMLTDGTVIQDMEANGAVLSQKISDFPPLFQEALGHLKNHGSMTMVVPPALAYGEKGYPPKVPPDATMIYQLRVAEMYPKGKQVAPK